MAAWRQGSPRQRPHDREGQEWGHANFHPASAWGVFCTVCLGAKCEDMQEDMQDSAGHAGHAGPPALRSAGQSGAAVWMLVLH